VLSLGASNVPVRILTQRVTYQADGQTYFLQALQDRSTEVDTLNTLLVVLIVGGLVVVLVAAGFGWVYAERALVPIRDSLVAQRAALGRQREFAADASHELRTPLTVIRSSVEHLRRHADEPVAGVGDALEDIDAEVSHLTTMVDDLLLLARSDSGAVSLERVPLHLDDVAAEAAAALTGPAAGRNVRVVVDPEPVQLTGDAARLRQLTTILIDNAIRHSPAGGEVRVTVRAFEDEAQLSVADQGPGIRSDDLPHVFDRFWRAAGAPAGGTGLGLAIAKWIAERHAGSITAANGANGGALFVVRLPIESTPD
jgi:signal transduction histidine kinase